MNEFEQMLREMVQKYHDSLLIEGEVQEHPFKIMKDIRPRSLELLEFALAQCCADHYTTNDGVGMSGMDFVGREPEYTDVAAALDQLYF